MKYFFHLEDGACIRDPKGEEFPDDAAALLEAARVAQELSKLRVHAYEWRVVVKNADRRSRRFGAANTSPRRTSALTVHRCMRMMGGKCAAPQALRH
jgi:hypothetical protein